MDGHAARWLSERGDLSSYLAAGMLLPLLLLISGGGAATLGLLSDRQAVVAISYAALRQADAQGGLTPSLAQSLKAQLQRDLPRLLAVQVSGTPAATPWGEPLCLQVQALESWELPLQSPVHVQLGGEFCGVSDLPPSP